MEIQGQKAKEIKMEGDIITPRILASRWSFAEVRSRFRNKYSDRFTDDQSTDLIAKTENRTSFGELSRQEQEMLAVWFETGFRRTLPTLFSLGIERSVAPPALAVSWP
jgi:hypothetical protein